LKEKYKKTSKDMKNRGTQKLNIKRLFIKVRKFTKREELNFLRKM